MKVLLPLLLAINLFAETYIIPSNNNIRTLDNIENTNYIRTLCIDGLVFIMITKAEHGSALVQAFERVVEGKPSLYPPQPKTCEKQ